MHFMFLVERERDSNRGEGFDRLSSPYKEIQADLEQFVHVSSVDDLNVHGI